MDRWEIFEKERRELAGVKRAINCLGRISSRYCGECLSLVHTDSTKGMNQETNPDFLVKIFNCDILGIECTEVYIDDHSLKNSHMTEGTMIIENDDQKKKEYKRRVLAAINGKNQKSSKWELPLGARPVLYVNLNEYIDIHIKNEEWIEYLNAHTTSYNLFLIILDRRNDYIVIDSELKVRQIKSGGVAG